VLTEPPTEADFFIREGSMLSDARVNATIPAADLERARRFYEEKLGLAPAEETPGGVFYDCAGGTRFFLYPTQGASSGSHTQAGFDVADIEAEVADLKSRGVEFLEYDFPGLKTVNGIADTGNARAAWFNDSEGNVLGIVQLG
jgi:catechol 2,3-dioxygenase-like lactoylglutathione lyase family enzyme